MEEVLFTESESQTNELISSKGSNSSSPLFFLLLLILLMGK